MNAIDKVVAFFDPHAGIRRRAAREILGKYEAATPSRNRKFYGPQPTQNQTVQSQAKPLLQQVRHLTKNHDLAAGALRTLVNNVAGDAGVGIEPQPRMADGSIHEDYASKLREAYRDWCRKPEVTHQYSMSQLQRAVVRSWLRDGEVFAQFIQGNRPDLNHGTRVPLSLEVFESDLVPFDTDENRRIAQGIERNSWGQPTQLHCSRLYPWRLNPVVHNDTRTIPWERVIHLATREYLHQMRGVSVFANVVTRFEDIKDYEESERVAAKVAAMLCAYIKKGTPEAYNAEEVDDEIRQVGFDAAMIIDDLMPGESIGMIDSKRPNPNLVMFRQGQLKAMAAGIGASYSSIAKDYSGSYSAQRQEMVEQWVNYAALSDEFVGSFLDPVWRRFVVMADLSGIAKRPKEVTRESMDDALYVAQAMPWIDPLKEALGFDALVSSGFASEVEVIRRRGKNPRDVLQQIKSWRQLCKDEGVAFSSNEVGLAEALRLAEGGDK